MNLHFIFKDYITHQHPMNNDYQGKVVTTLIESRNNKVSNTASVLYIHGFCDYFFQMHVMNYFTDHGINFYAIDLRKCGRSLLSHQSPNYCKNLREYFPDIDYGINWIFKQNPESKLFLLGHSTGGLLATYYAKFGIFRPKITGLILNSPFFDFNLPFYIKPFIESIANKRYAKDPYGHMQGLPSLYGQSLHKDYQGQWDYNLNYKPIVPFQSYYAWILAVLKAQRVIVEKPDLGETPILIFHSSQSSNPRKYTKQTNCSDVVLEVKDMIKVGSKLADNVSFYSIENALHDVFLSEQEPRNSALKRCVDFIKALI